MIENIYASYAGIPYNGVGGVSSGSNKNIQGQKDTNRPSPFEVGSKGTVGEVVSDSSSADFVHAPVSASTLYNATSIAQAPIEPPKEIKNLSKQSDIEQETDITSEYNGRQNQADNKNQEELEQSAKEDGSQINEEEMTLNELRVIAQMQMTDRKVRAHERAHKTVGGAYTGAISYEYDMGPDDKRYVVGGEVPIDTSPVTGDPQATISKMRVVKAAALAPADPSPQDRKVAMQAEANMRNARGELRKLRAEERKARQEESQARREQANAELSSDDNKKYEQASNAYNWLGESQSIEKASQEKDKASGELQDVQKALDMAV